MKTIRTMLSVLFLIAALGFSGAPSVGACDHDYDDEIEAESKA